MKVDAFEQIRIIVAVAGALINTMKPKQFDENINKNEHSAKLSLGNFPKRTFRVGKRTHGN